jgi:deoxyribose-phosphate aldolase
LSKLIDHTLLKPDTTAAGITELTQEARQYEFASVCVNPCWVARCAELLAGSDVAVCTVVGFPLGATTTEVKVFEAEQALRNGAGEIDAVIDIAAVKEGRDDEVLAQLQALAEAVHPHGLLKVIIETCLLTDEQIVRASRLVKRAGADFVKTSTGFSTGGATVRAVRLIREAVGPDMGVKAAGGVHTLAELEDLVAAGATRIGASAGVAIVLQERDRVH